MGRIGFVESIEANTTDGEAVADIKTDLGGGDIIWAPLLSSAGNGSRPLPGDYVALVDHPGGSKASAVGFADPENESPATNGEAYMYGRDSSGAVVAIVWLKGDGSVEITSDSTVTINGNLTVDP